MGGSIVGWGHVLTIEMKPGPRRALSSATQRTGQEASGGEAKGRAERVPVPESVQTSGQRRTACTGSFNNGNGDCGSIRGVLLAERVTMRMVLEAQDAPCVLVKRGDRKAREVCISAAFVGFRIWGAVTNGEEWM